jgi:HAD superfamily hydrolase (TIGR01509 family)
VREVSRAFFEAREAAMQPYEDVEDTVRALRERGVQLVAATNGNATMVSLPVFQQMHLLFTAEDYGVAKPDARFFLEAMARSGARPETSLMVGDRMDNDILPALSLGMYGALLDRDGGAPDVDVPRLDSLTDLLTLIEVVPTAS